MGEKVYRVLTRVAGSDEDWSVSKTRLGPGEIVRVINMAKGNRVMVDENLMFEYRIEWAEIGPWELEVELT